MENSVNHTGDKQTPNASLQFMGFKVPLWAAFAAGAITTLLLVYFGTLRPTARQLAQLQTQIGKLEASVRQVVGAKESVATTNDLLGLLAQQREQVAEATIALDNLVQLKQNVLTGEENSERAQASLSRFAALLDALIDVQKLPEVGSEAVASMNELRSTVLVLREGVQHANERLEQLISLEDRLGEQRASTPAAEDALAALVELKDHTLSQVDDLQRVQTVVAEWDALHSRMADSVDVTTDARRVSTALLDLQSSLLCRGSETSEAQTALSELMGMCQQLDTQGELILAANSRLDGLLTLKDNVLTQTDDLVDAIETLEATDDFHDQLQGVAADLRTMRIAVVEILALSSTIEQAMRVLEPLTELGNLRRLGKDDLRQLASVILSKRKSELASRSDGSATAPVVESPSPKALPMATATTPNID